MVRGIGILASQGGADRFGRGGSVWQWVVVCGGGILANQGGTGRFGVVCSGVWLLDFGQREWHRPIW